VVSAIGKVLEGSDNKSFKTYFKLGPLKFKEEKWDKVKEVSLEQDQKKYYCIIIQTASGSILQIEKYPTFKDANIRLSEFKRLF